MCPSSPSQVFKCAWGRHFFTAKVLAAVGDSWTVHICKVVEELPARTGIGVIVNDKDVLLQCTVKKSTT
jgi:hypothetical protein